MIRSPDHVIRSRDSLLVLVPRAGEHALVLHEGLDVLVQVVDGVHLVSLAVGVVVEVPDQDILMYTVGVVSLGGRWLV